MKDVSIHKEIVTQYWKSFYKHRNVTQDAFDAAEWHQCVDEFDMIADSYRETKYEQFASKMFLAFMSEIERLSKENEQ